VAEDCTLNKPCYYCAQEMGGAMTGYGYAGPPCILDQGPTTWKDHLRGVFTLCLVLGEVVLLFAWAVQNS